MTTTNQKQIVERIFPDDIRVKPQTIVHHKARYQFATKNGGFPIRNYLDLGSGTGYGCEMIRLAGAKKCFGIDISEEAVKYSRDNYKENQYVLGSVSSFGFPRMFDLITCFEVIEHLTHAQGVAMIKKAHLQLVRDGIFILSTPRDNNSKYNSYHKSQWDYATLKNTLGDIFSEVTVYGQDWDTGEVTLEQPMTDDFFVVVCKK